MTHTLFLRGQDQTHQVFRDQSLLIVAPDGEVQTGTQQGLYYANTRLLSRLALHVNNRPPLPVQLAPARDDFLVGYFQDPRVTDADSQQDRTLGLQLSITMGTGAHLDLDAHNYSPRPITCELRLVLAADFADFDEARLGERHQQAPVQRECALETAGELRFTYQHPKLQEAVTLQFSTRPGCDEEGVSWPLALPPQTAWHTCIDILPTHQGITPTLTSRCYGAHTPDAAGPPAWTAAAMQVSTSNDTVRRTYERAVSDLAALALREGPPAEQAAFAAGIPVFHTPFGRDLLTTAWQSLLATPALLESAILVCERYQGSRNDDFRDEQPGRIIQRVRTGPLNLLGLNPQRRYYSDYASPPDFLIMLGQHLMWTGDRDFFREHLPAAERVLAWLDRDADLDGDGFYEYRSRSPQGDRNQGWKDSPHAIVDQAGEDAALPLATCEVQGYVYAGKQQVGAALLMQGQISRGLHLLREARTLKHHFNRAFWMPDQQFLAMALDGDKRQVRAVGSNAGHCLATGIVDAAYAPAVARRLMAPDLFSGWGVRTLSTAHAAYNPFSYHLGSVWTVEQGTIAFGLKRYGFDESASTLARGIFDLAGRHALHRLPEAVGGHPRDQAHPFPGLYPRSCWPQAWSAGAVILLLQAMLGLRPIAPLGVLLVYPELPSWLPDLTLTGLQVGNSRLTVQFRRQKDGTTDYRVLERTGRIRVIRAAPDSSVRHSLGQRLRAPVGPLLTGRW